MRIRLASLSLLLLCGVVRADCPNAPCFPGGGAHNTDCFVEWSGVTGASNTCVDGTACDMDGKVDGVCTFAVSACTNVQDTALGCTPSTLSAPPSLSPKSDPAMQALAAALGGLAATSGCTAPGIHVPLKFAGASVKKGTLKLRMTAKSGSQRDSDKLTFTCLPGNPSFANDIQTPIFDVLCATSGCHKGFGPSGNLNLEAGQARANMIGVTSPEYPHHVRVIPGNPKKSLLSQKVTGAIPRQGTLGAFMPLGLPRLTPQQNATILEWIASGAPDN
jgi:hypothetical protein